MFNPHFGTFGKYSDIFGQIRLSEKLNKCHFTSTSRHFTIIMSCFQSYISEHSINIRTHSAFGKIRPSDNFRFRTYAILHCLNQIRIFYNFLIKTCFHHNMNFVFIRYTKKFFKNILLSAQWIVIPAKMMVACSLERRWIAEGTRHRPERQNS